MSSENESNLRSSHKKTTYDDLYEVFQDSFVHIVTKSLKGSETRGSTKYVGPVVIEGFLLGYTQDYYLLGKDPDQITDSVRKDEVVRMFLPEQELIDLMFGSVDKPNIGDMS